MTTQAEHEDEGPITLSKTGEWCPCGHFECRHKGGIEGMDSTGRCLDCPCPKMQYQPPLEDE